jgi:hypothetical protein
MYYKGLLLGDTQSLRVYSVLHRRIPNFVRSPRRRDGLLIAYCIY